MCLLARAALGSLILGLAACSSPTLKEPGPPSTASRSLLEDRLLDILQQERELDAQAAMDADRGQIQRQFHAVAAAYRDLLAFNPDSLDTRLLYGKLLSRYGDRDGARDQFILAARIDSEIAVIHQQLSTYYAEERDHTRALAFMLNAIEIEPQTAAYHFGLGQLLVTFRTQFIEEAIYSEDQLDREILNAFKTAANLAPNEVALQFRYGEAFYDVAAPDWQIALNHWQSIQYSLPMDPLQIDALRIHLARCFMALNNISDAQSALQQVSQPSLLPSAQALLQIIQDEQ